MSKKQAPRIFDKVPLANVGTFKNVSAPCYVGVGGALDLNEKPEVGVIIVAKDVETLKAFYEHIGIELVIDRTRDLVVAWRHHMHVMHADDLSGFKSSDVDPIKHIDHPTPTPAPAPAAATTEEEDW